VPLDATPPTPTVAATASTSSQVVDPFYVPTKVITATGGALHALQPVSGHVQNDGRNRAQSSAVPPPLPAPMHTATASTSSQVVDPFSGPTKVISFTGGASHALQPDPGHVQNDGRASVPRTTVQHTLVLESLVCRNPTYPVALAPPDPDQTRQRGL
jgi:hypothetical protein